MHSEVMWSKRKNCTLCIRCKANNTAVIDSAFAADCHMSSRPVLAMTELNVFTYFAAGIAMSSWLWQKSTVKAWKCFLKRLAFVVRCLHWNKFMVSLKQQRSIR